MYPKLTRFEEPEKKIHETPKKVGNSIKAAKAPHLLASRTREP